MIIYAAADVNYFIEHGIEFINSCVENENYCHVTIFPNFEEELALQQHRLFHFMKNTFQHLHSNAKRYLYSPEFFTSMYDCDILASRAYYASFRFLHLPTIMDRFPGANMLVLDIDSLILKNLPEPTEQVGLYLRLNNTVGGDEYEVEGMKVAAGILYVQADQLEFASSIRDKIMLNKVRWFNDQHAIYNTYKQFKDTTSIYDFSQDSKWLDWNFNDDSMIWTAKGDRKNNPRYLEWKKKYEVGGFGSALERS
jgi:hypothetical protein